MHISSYITKIFIGVVVVVLLGGYALFEARGLILGPHIYIDAPQNGATYAEPLMHISGRTRFVTTMTINNRPIALHENGTFTNALPLKAGYNVIVLEAQDRFDRSVTQTLHLMHNRAQDYPLDIDTYIPYAEENNDIQNTEEDGGQEELTAE